MCSRRPASQKYRDNRRTLKIGVSEYAGQAIKLRFGQGSFSTLLDNVGLGETLLPGWTMLGTSAAQGLSDANGSYITQYPGSSGALKLRSSTIQTNIVAGSGGTQYLAVAYEIGFSTGSLLRVFWDNASTGQE